MTDTVTRLMALAGTWADATADVVDPINSREELDDALDRAKNARQALHDELVRLFTPLNQCDGCMAGLPLRNGLHIDTDGKALMLCQKSKYGIGGES